MAIKNLIMLLACVFFLSAKTYAFQIDSIKLYNIITPNGDGQNDLLIIDGLNSNLVTELRVINNWGQKVYENKNYANTWGGTDNSGNPLPAGNYFYLVRTGASIFKRSLTIIYE